MMETARGMKTFEIAGVLDEQVLSNHYVLNYKLKLNTPYNNVL